MPDFDVTPLAPGVAIIVLMVAAVMLGMWQSENVRRKYIPGAIVALGIVGVVCLLAPVFGISEPDFDFETLGLALATLSLLVGVMLLGAPVELSRGKHTVSDLPEAGEKE